MNTKSESQFAAKFRAKDDRPRRLSAWVGLALTVASSTTLFAGYFLFSNAGALMAAPRTDDDDVIWKAKAPAAPTSQVVIPAVVPGTAKPEDPFKLSQQAQIPASTVPAAVGTLPNSRVKSVLQNYGQAGVQQTGFQPPLSPLPKNPPEDPKLKLDPPANTPQTKPADTGAPARPTEPAILQGEQIPTKPKPVNQGRPNRTPEDEALLTAARTAYEQSRYDIAAERFERYLSLHPKDVEIRREYAGVLNLAGEPRRAAAQYEILIADDPNSLEYRALVGDLYIIAKDYRKAIGHFATAIELNKSDPDAKRRLRSEFELSVRLARAFAFDGDYKHAEQVYDRFLATIRPEDPTAPPALGALLLDLERPNEALSYLMEQKKRNPENLEVLASLVRALARLGERQAAMEQLVAMAGVKPKEKAVRIVLGDSLFAAEEFEIAGHVYNQVLQVDPANGNALIGLAKVHLAMYLPANAKKILDSFVPGNNVQRAYLLTYAEYHQVVGEYTEAKLIYKDMLRRNELDHEVRLSLGLLFDYTKEWEKAKAEYAKIPPNFPIIGKKARLAFAASLFNQRKYQEAVDVTRTILTDFPDDPAVISQMIRHLAKAGQADQGVALARAFLASNPRSEVAAFSIRSTLAKTLLECNRYLDASREYEIILSRPIGRVPSSYYGLARASEKMGNVQRASELIGCIIGVLGGDTRQRLVLADLYSADYDDAHVVELCMGALQYDPNNLAVLIRLADGMQRQARYTGQPQAAFEYCIRILNLSPTNVRGHLAMSRCFAIAQNYRKSAAQYMQLIQIDPEFTIPPRERARVLYSDHQFSAARSQYQAMLSPAPDQYLIGELAGVVQRQPKVRTILEPYTMTSLTGPGLRKEMERVACTLPDDEAKLAVLRLINDYDAKVAEQKAFALEMEAKELKDYRNYQALPAYDAINRYEPTNTETLFDMGQVYGALTMTRRAQELYNGTLAVDPTHRDTMVAIERSGADLNPSLDMSYDYFRERGRDGLASIDRQRLSTGVKLPWGDENEYIEFGYDRVLYQPTIYNNDDGNIPWIRMQKKFDDNRLLLYGQMNLELFQNGFQTRPTFDVGFQYAHDDCLKTRGGLYLDNVAENGESIRQDIHRFGAYVGADVLMTRTWDFGGTYRYGHYSDSNNMNMLELYNENSLTLPPKQLKIVEKYTFYGYSSQTIFPTDPPNPLDLFGTIHPYFAPKTFNYGEIRLEWWHWFSRDYFVHSDQCWYSLQYGLGADDRLVTYNDFKGLINYDITSWMTFGIMGHVQLSSAYKMYEAMGYVSIRMP
ncbi:tetratricopeptide repeat protein [Telmatocola sphagniphila]|uniref:Tetratricopeptide repeat protein n=1 Tax=Telmatocola sphagniphila TaxID=1123043 RepID=A0A8E6EW44_9BACT|nr:tetratricopeptide repeat protein [Telmatocola sphagniphila]QVL33412.1 tetratricopeptide repeat protein [Telmatocola sphagniphila]